MEDSEPKDTTMKHYAQLSDGAYGGGQDLSHMGYTIDTELSNRNRTLYRHNETGKAVLSFRGTELRTGNRKADLGTDALLTLGLQKLSSRFNNAKKATKSAIEKYGHDNVTLTGHSLGGAQALYANSHFKLPTHVYNPAVSLNMVGKDLADSVTSQLFKKKPSVNAHIYTTGKDIISGLSPLLTRAKTFFVKKKKGATAHSLSNFL